MLKELQTTQEYQERKTYFPAAFTCQTGQIYSVDAVVESNGRFYENKSSEEWEAFEYEWDKNHRKW